MRLRMLQIVQLTPLRKGSGVAQFNHSDAFQNTIGSAVASAKSYRRELKSS